jgi:nucleoside-diphosphate-sugar epimerase
MRVFLTGATGFIGARIIPELLAAGHQVLGMTRSEDGARRLSQAGVQVHRGTLEDPASVGAGAAQADAVIHTAFDHDFANFAANCEKDVRVIEAIGRALKGSTRPLLLTSGVGMGSTQPGVAAVESVFDAHNMNPRSASEKAGLALSAAGVDVRVVRLPQVHDTVKQGLITPYVERVREKGYLAYLGDGANRWSAAHVLDVAKLYQLVLDRGQAGARYHASAEAGIPMRDVATTLGKRLGLPVRSISQAEVADYFGWMAMFAALDLTSSSDWTRQQLGWHPSGPTLLADLERLEVTGR